MKSKQLQNINLNSKIILNRSKKLLNLTGKLLETKSIDLDDEEWMDYLIQWLDENIIQERTIVPKNKDELIKVKTLSLRWNRLKSLPKEFFNLKQLEILELNNNALEVLQDEICKLRNLKELNLNINNLKTLPKEIINLKKLKILNIKNNKYLDLDVEQINWLLELKKNGCNIIYDKYKFNLGV